MARFLVYLEPAEEGGYIVSAPALPGCVTQGETKEEALAMVQDAIRGYILSLSNHGESLPSGYEAGEFEVVEIETAA
ncbi:MAG: type II toxin-antitoxin system HicB family antitoxin [Gammaproteobacteria bacterium]